MSRVPCIIGTKIILRWKRWAFSMSPCTISSRTNCKQADNLDSLEVGNLIRVPREDNLGGVDLKSIIAAT